MAKKWQKTIKNGEKIQKKYKKDGFFKKLY